MLHGAESLTPAPNPASEPAITPPAPPALPTLQAASCCLEPLLAAHASEMFQVLSDPAIYAFENAPPVSVEALAQRYRRLEGRVSDDGGEWWLNWVVRLPDGRLAGYVQATVWPSAGSTRWAAVAYEFNSQHWRQGLGGAALRAMRVALHGVYGVQQCGAVLKAANFRSKALLLSQGFVPATLPPPEMGPLEADELFMARSEP
jgi:ribosomal-protein-alanine N-acetyltransferase